MSTPEQSLLGKPAAYSDHYDPTLLFPIPRADKRAELGLSGQPPFFGADQWTAFELSWLTPRGKPQVALAHVVVPCETPHIIESKSFKLYLNSFNSTAFASAEAVRDRLRADLTEAVWRVPGAGAGGGAAAAAGAAVGVRLVLPEDFGRERMAELEGLSLDRMDIDCDRYTPAPEYLVAASGEPPVDEVLVSHLLKSNCLVTGQPDWGSVRIAYSGAPIDQAGLLRYLVSFRNHNEFHEQCVERIFMDIWRRCRPLKLEVYARYTRRGGLDINPWRTSHPSALPPTTRTARQ